MDDSRKTKKQLIAELAEERRKSSNLEKLVSYINHELRNLIISTIGRAKNLQRMYENPKGPKASKLSKIVVVLKHLDGFIQSIVNFVYMNSAEMRIEEFYLDEIITLVKIACANKLVGKRIELIEPIEKIPIRACKVGFGCVILNLVENGIKYGGSQCSKIIIGYNEDPDSHVVTVSNNGVGIKKENCERIFELFERQEDTLNAIPGSGIGLAMVKELTEKHGGSVKLVSNGIRGVEFIIKIPKSL